MPNSAAARGTVEEMSGSNGSDGDDEQFDDRTPTLVGHPLNRPILKTLGNIRLAFKANAVELGKLYTALRAASQPAPEWWAQQLVQQLDSMQATVGAEVEELRKIAAG